MIPNNVQNRFNKIEEDKLQLIKELSKYSNEELNKKPADGGWSPMQVIQHLIESESGSLKYMQKKLSFNPTLETTSFVNDLKFFAFKIFFRSPIKVKAPKGVSSDLPEFSDFKTTIKTWDESRQILKKWLENTDDNLWDKCIFKHPVLGRISLNHTLGFHDEHLRRHTKQIKRAL